ncbi:MAG: DUF3606 domain-containing protein [Chitinophagaceae bacterium]
MADNPKDTGHPDRDLINISQDFEVRYWSNKWGISPEQLRQAHRKAQPSESVRRVHDAAVALGFMRAKI